MAHIVIYDTNTLKVLDYKMSVNTPDYMGRNDVLFDPVLPTGIPLKYLKVDSGQVVEMNQPEKNAIDAAEAQAAVDAENARITSLDDKMDIDLSGMTLTKADNAIDNMGSLADAKTFLKKLCRYIIKFVRGGI